MAAALTARGVGRGDIVALLLERTPTMLAALLGVLAIGATYVPLDPGFPASRLAFMLADAGAKVVITDQVIAASSGFENREPSVAARSFGGLRARSRRAKRRRTRGQLTATAGAPMRS